MWETSTFTWLSSCSIAKPLWWRTYSFFCLILVLLSSFVNNFRVTKFRPEVYNVSVQKFNLNSAECPLLCPTWCTWKKSLNIPHKPFTKLTNACKAYNPQVCQKIIFRIFRHNIKDLILDIGKSENQAKIKFIKTS